MIMYEDNARADQRDARGARAGRAAAHDRARPPRGDARAARAGSSGGGIAGLLADRTLPGHVAALAHARCAAVPRRAGALFRRPVPARRACCAARSSSWPACYHGAQPLRAALRPTRRLSARPRRRASTRCADRAPRCERYVATLEALCREAPYNWFNFFDFWADDRCRRPPAAALSRRACARALRAAASALAAARRPLLSGAGRVRPRAADDAAAAQVKSRRGDVHREAHASTMLDRTLESSGRLSLRGARHLRARDAEADASERSRSPATALTMSLGERSRTAAARRGARGRGHRRGDPRHAHRQPRRARAPLRRRSVSAQRRALDARARAARRAPARPGRVGARQRRSSRWCARSQVPMADGDRSVMTHRARQSHACRRRRASGRPTASPLCAPRAALALWLALALAVALAIARARYVADLSAFLPSAPTRRAGGAARPAAQRRRRAPGADRHRGRRRRDARSRRLARSSPRRCARAGAFDAVHNGDNASSEASGQFLFEHRYLLSPAVDAARFTVDGLRAAHRRHDLAARHARRAALIKPVLLRDPTGETVRMAEAHDCRRSAPTQRGRRLGLAQAPRAVLLATTRADGADLDGQERALRRVRAGVRAAGRSKGCELALSGLGVLRRSRRARRSRPRSSGSAIAGSV